MLDANYLYLSSDWVIASMHLLLLVRAHTVVQKPLNGNLGLKVKQGFLFLLLKSVSTANFKFHLENRHSQNLGQNELRRI